MSGPLELFAEEVGPAGTGPVTCVGGRTQWDVGGSLSDPAREVSAPSGVVAHEPGEMIVRVRAATTIAELDEALARGRQFVAVDADDPERATVGGVLACGRSGVRRLGRGPVRDSVLEVTAVSAAGEVIRAGAPLVKNVTGFDLCRLLVGSVGTLAFLGEVVLRCHPRPEVETWWASEPGSGVDPFALASELYRPLAVLWDGDRVWVGLSGSRTDVAEQSRQVLAFRAPFSEAAGPPPRPEGGRRSFPPTTLPSLPALAPDGAWLAEVGVGLVHVDQVAAGALAPPPPSEGVVALHRRLKANFDPGDRLNPGRSPLSALAAVP